MKSQSLRLKILKKIAQINQTNLPTDEVAKTMSVSGAPPSFVASEYYPSIIVGFQAKNVPWINSLSNTLNLSLFYTSNGEINMRGLRQVNFNFSADQAPSVDLRNIMNFCKLVYNEIFTNLEAPYLQPLSPEQIAVKINKLNTSPFLNNLSQVSSTGQLATKLGGNLKTIIINHLMQIK